MTLEPGARLGPYEIVAQLGQGGVVIAGWQQLFSLMEGQGLLGLQAPRR